jgi:hypothetical protein
MQENANHLARELRNAPESYWNCLKDLKHCHDKTAARFIYLICWRIIREYKADLFRQAEGKWQSIPANVVNRIAHHYPEIEVDKVMFAPAIDTRHGQHITWGNRFFYSKKITPDTIIDFTEYRHASVLLHELEHVVQYHRRGEEAFLGEYILKAAGKIIQKRSVNIHDVIDIERAAIAKEDELVPQYCTKDPHTGKYTTCTFP